MNTKHLRALTLQLLLMQDLTFNNKSNNYIRGQRIKVWPVDEWNPVPKEIIDEVLKPFMTNYKEEKDYGYKFIRYSTSQSFS